MAVMEASSGTFFSVHETILVEQSDLPLLQGSRKKAQPRLAAARRLAETTRSCSSSRDQVLPLKQIFIFHANLYKKVS